MSSARGSRERPEKDRFTRERLVRRLGNKHQKLHDEKSQEFVRSQDGRNRLANGRTPAIASKQAAPRQPDNNRRTEKAR